jgi:hypothetical protein
MKLGKYPPSQGLITCHSSRNLLFQHQLSTTRHQLDTTTSSVSVSSSVQDANSNHIVAAMPPLQLSETVLTFLQKIANATNAAAAKDEKLDPQLPTLSSPSRSMLTLYRGHLDMPTELRVKLPFITAPEILGKMWDEIGEDEEDWVLTTRRLPD